MRKIFNTLTAVALAVATSLSLTACGDDDDDPAAPNAALQSIVWEVEGAVSDEAAQIFDYALTISLPNGEVQRLGDVILGKAAMGTVAAADLKFPAVFTLTVVRTVKSTFSYQEGDKASWTEDFELELNLLDENKAQIASRDCGDELKVTGIDLASYLPERGNKTYTYTLTVQKTSNGYEIVK